MRDEGNEKEINEGTPSRSSPTDSKQITRSDYLYKVAITSLLIVSFSVEVMSTSKRYKGGSWLSMLFHDNRTSVGSQFLCISTALITGLRIRNNAAGMIWRGINHKRS